MADSSDDFEIVDRSDLTEDSEPSGFSEHESSWPDEFEVGTEIEVDPARGSTSTFARIREFIAIWLGRGQIAQSGFEVVEPGDHSDTIQASTHRGNEFVSRSLSSSADLPRVIETKATSTRISGAEDPRPSKSPMASDAMRTVRPLPMVTGRDSGNPLENVEETPDRFEDHYGDGHFDTGEVAIAESTSGGRHLTWREILAFPLAPLKWIVSKVLREKRQEDITDDFAVASKRKVLRVRRRDTEIPGESSPEASKPATLSDHDTDELKIGTRSVVRKISDTASDEHPQHPAGESVQIDEYSVISASQLGTASYRPGTDSNDDHAPTVTSAETSQDSGVPFASSAAPLDPANVRSSTISGRLQKLLEQSDYARTGDVLDEHVEVGLPLETDANHAAIRTKSLGNLFLRLISWFVTIPFRCMNSEGDLFEQRRLKIEPLISAIPATVLLISLALQLSRVSLIDKLESYTSFLKESQQYEISGNTGAAMLAAVRSCVESATPDNRFQVAKLYTKTRNPVDMAHGLRMMRLLASTSGGNQADAHLFIANEILRQYERDPGANRGLFFRYLSELRTGFGTSPNRYDILERLAEGLIAIGEDRSLTGLLVPQLEFWPHGHFFLAQAAFGRGDDELQKSHALAMVRHFRSTPAELELDQKYRLRFAISLALAGEFSDAESFVRQMVDSSQDSELRKSLREKIDLIRVIMRIHEFPANSDQDIEVLGSLLEVDELSPNFEAAIKRQLLRKGPLRPALLKLCRNLYLTRKASFDADDYVFWASILRQNQQNDEAREYLENAIKIRPEHDIASNNLANLLYKLEPVDLDRALSLSESVMKRNPKEPTFLETRGQILARLGKNQEAIADLTKSLEAFPNVPEIHEALSRCYRNIGKADLADAHQKRLAELKSSTESPVSKATRSNES